MKMILVFVTDDVATFENEIPRYLHIIKMHPHLDFVIFILFIYKLCLQTQLKTHTKNASLKILINYEL